MMQGTYVYQAITGICLFLGGFGISVMINKPDTESTSCMCLPDTETRLKRVEELLRIPSPVAPAIPKLPNGAIGDKE